MKKITFSSVVTEFEIEKSVSASPKVTQSEVCVGCTSIMEFKKLPLVSNISKSKATVPLLTILALGSDPPQEDVSSIDGKDSLEFKDTLGCSTGSIEQLSIENNSIVKTMRFSRLVFI